VKKLSIDPSQCSTLQCAQIVAHSTNVIHRIGHNDRLDHFTEKVSAEIKGGNQCEDVADSPDCDRLRCRF
jgi:hypothetical protein